MRDAIPFTDAVSSRGSGSNGLPQREWAEFGRFPVIGQGEEYVEGWSDREDLVISPERSLVLYGGHTRRAKLVSRPFIPGPNVKILIPSEDLDAAYLYRFLEQLQIESRGYADHFSDVKRCRIPLVPLLEQKRIAVILDAVNTLQAKRRESLNQLDVLIQSIFFDMFGDPVTNPMEWEKTKLDALIEPGDKINYGVVQPGNDWPDGKPLIRVGDFVNGELETVGVKLIDPNIEKRYRRSRLNGHELLVSCVGSIGTICKVPSYAAGFNIARAVARVPLREETSRDFMVYCLRSEAVQRHFLKETRTVSQPTLNISLIKNAPIIYPPIDLQQRFATIVESVERQKQRLRAHLAELDALFASLQFRAFNGEL